MIEARFRNHPFVPSDFLVGRVQDAALAVLAIAVISLMVLPLPPAALDTLISINIGLSVMLLMMAMYVKTPLGLSTFPTLLLFTTLFRLSLNIASTRAILLNADAGRIIETFGELVVGGSIIVGVVIFLIIAIVQFIVIAKGSERVAEVCARFTLDALPGRQMSIDAELRAGVIDKDESHRKRGQLQRESQLYGAMDGAMKFVKGDAIAGMLIALVNIIAGISIGIGVREMSVADAASTYTLLTIGDGLVSQIPALFVALSAGVLITRVSGDENDAHPGLSREIGGQIGAQPKALLVTAIVLLMFMLVPGFPKFQFLGWGLGFGLLGIFLARLNVQKNPYDPMTIPGFHRDGMLRHRSSAELDTELVTSYAVSLRLGMALRELLESGSLTTEVDLARRNITGRLGVPFPGISIVLSDQIDADQFEVMIDEIPVKRGRIVPGKVLAMADLPRIGFDSGVEDIEPAPGGGGFWVDENRIDELSEAGISYLFPMAVIGESFRTALRENGREFVGIQEVKHLLGEAEKAFPDLVAEASRGVPILRLAEVLRRLVDENVPIRNMRAILEALVEWAPKEKDGVLLTECVRNALARQLTYQHASAEKKIYAITLEASVEETVRSAVQQTPGGNFLALSPEQTERIASQIVALANQPGQGGSRAVLLAAMDVRRYLRQIVEEKMPELAVLSYQNLTSDVVVHPVGIVNS